MRITSYQLDRRGNILNDAYTSFTKLSDAVKSVTSNKADTITFVDVAENEMAAVAAFLANDKLSLYATSRKGRYVLGYTKGTSRIPIVECAVE